jgi:hypothetical protein
MKVLSKVLEVDDQALVIWVAYDVKTNVVTSIKSIQLINNGHMLPVGNLLMKFFEPAINKIIDETDWREMYHVCYRSMAA